MSYSSWYHGSGVYWHYKAHYKFQTQLMSLMPDDSSDDSVRDRDDTSQSQLASQLQITSTSRSQSYSKPISRVYYRTSLSRHWSTPPICLQTCVCRTECAACDPANNSASYPAYSSSAGRGYRTATQRATQRPTQQGAQQAQQGTQRIWVSICTDTASNSLSRNNVKLNVTSDASSRGVSLCSSLCSRSAQLYGLFPTGLCS
jgi:hypothetical protein